MKHTGNCWYISWGGKENISFFYDWIYRNTTIYLERKNNVFNNILS